MLTEILILLEKITYWLVSLLGISYGIFIRLDIA
jgi:hypothetical protein